MTAHTRSDTCVDFPRSPTELDATWLHRTLVPFFPDVPPVAALRWERIGTGQMGCNVRVTLDYRGSAHLAPRSVVCKFPSLDSTSRATALALRSYEIETCFYRQVAAHLPLPVPRCFFAACEPASGDFLLVLEDIQTAEPGDQLAPCTPSQARYALDALAAIHAATWERPELERLEWLNRRSESTRQQIVQFFQAAATAFLERYGEFLAARHVRVLEEFVPLMAAWSELPRPPFALQHGDFRPDNVLFLRRRTSPYRALVVDWQTVSWGPPLADVSYFIGGAFSPEERRRYEGDLLVFYCERLRRHGVRDVSFIRCVEDHSVYAFTGLVMAVAAAMLVERTPRGDRMFLTMFARHAQHVLDLSAFSILDPDMLAKRRDHGSFPARSS